MEINAIAHTATKMTLNKLSDQELCALSLCISAGWDVTTRPEYQKVKSLFTEMNGAKMHDETKRSFDAIVAERL